jgi:hypothetical protein
LAFSFSDGNPGDGPETPGSTNPPGETAGVPAPASEVQAPGATRFNSCRWQQPLENGIAAFCTHREVKPYAGTTGFDPEAWCPDCGYYKLRRVPKKRNRDEYPY